MGHPKKVTDARLKATLRKHDGMQALTAHTLGVSRQNVQQRIQRSPELQQFLADISAKMDDTCEGGIFKKLKNGDGATLRWYAERKLPERGYRTKIEGPEPPPPDNSKRALIVNVLVQNLNAKAASIHAEVHCDPQNALTLPVRRLNGHNSTE